MAWYSRVFPSCRKVIASQSQTIHGLLEQMKTFHQLQADKQYYESLAHGVNALILSSQELVDFVRTENRYKAVCVIRNGDDLTVRIYNNFDDSKHILYQSHLEAEIHTNDKFNIRSVEICELISPPNSGDGSLLLGALLKYIERMNEPYRMNVYGTLAPVDYRDHPERLTHFYQKHGFTVLDTSIKDQKSILRKVSSVDAARVDELQHKIVILENEIKSIKSKSYT